MKRRVVIGFALMGAVLVILAIAVASVGTELDKTRLDRDELRFEADGLQEEVDNLTGERDTLKAQVDEQLKAIEQLKSQPGRTSSQVSQPSTAAPATPAPPSPASHQ